MKKNYFENEFAEFWIEDEILFFNYKKDINLNLATVKRVVADRIKVQEGLSYPVICDARGLKEADKEARDFLAKEGSELVIAVAIITGSPLTRFLFNFYVTINKPLTPTKMFMDQDQALSYLQEYKAQAV